MSQRDCGCPGLVTPTLDELLAVARQKPLPRVRVRERRAPPARVGATMKGWLSWQLIDRAGREVRAGEGPNLVLDQGLDLIATTAPLTMPTTAFTFPLITYAAVGTGSGTPDPSDTGLESELARVNTTFTANTVTRPSPGVYRLTRHIEFDYAVGNGVLTEWGFSPSAGAGSNLFNRALFVDGGGSPDAITKTDQEKLRLTYTLEVTLSPVALTAGSFDVTGVGTVNGDYMLVGGSAPSPSEVMSAPDIRLFSILARGPLGTVTGLSDMPQAGSSVVVASDLSGTAYSDNLWTNVAPFDVNAYRVRAVSEARDAYAAGSFERTGGAWTWDTQYGNADPIKGFALAGLNNGLSVAGMGYVFDLDTGDEFSKDDEHTLTIGAPAVTWGRAP